MTSGNGTPTHYVNNLEYDDTGLTHIYHAEGFLEPNGTNTYKYYYYLRDHLGNNRVVFQDANGNGTITSTEITEEHYYPFGMKMQGGWGNLGNDYQYNGKEYNEEYDLGWNSYGAREYDASIGRWMSVDPLAESYAGYSPYNYTMGNPIKFIDPDGMRVSLFDRMEDMGADHGASYEESQSRKNNEMLFMTLNVVAASFNNSNSRVKGIHFVFESFTEKIYDHTVDAQDSGHPSILHLIKGDPDLRDKNRREAMKGYKSGDPSPDEYPYASTYEGGEGASVRYVPLSEQRTQGGQLSILSRILNDKDAFAVVPIPKDDQYKRIVSAVKTHRVNAASSTITRKMRGNIRKNATIRALDRIWQRAAARFPFVIVPSVMDNIGPTMGPKSD